MDFSEVEKEVEVFHELEELFGKVYIPEAVYQELVINPMFKNEAREIECFERRKTV